VTSDVGNPANREGVGGRCLLKMPPINRSALGSDRAHQRIQSDITAFSEIALN